MLRPRPKHGLQRNGFNAGPDNATRKDAMDQLLFRRLAAGFATARFARRMADALFRALERSRQRRALRNLSDAQLADLGLSRAEVAAEARRPFWR
jgi:uncharacterized protein YjiS (DUF1127 family)